MSIPESILFATGNPHKLREVSQMLSALGVRVIGLEEVKTGVIEPEETGATFQDNAQLKALHYAAATGLTTLADDSGLEVDALGGEPGVVSARYAGVAGPRDLVDSANNAKLVQRIRAVPPEKRTARFVCVMALAEPGRVLAVTRGAVEGMIVTEPRGDNGFGYDPHFHLPQLGLTSAQLPPERKNALSHRGTAVRAMLREIERLGAERERGPGAGPGR
jgi:XTP/dITP diphosphohydrolase